MASEWPNRRLGKTKSTLLHSVHLSNYPPLPISPTPPYPLRTAAPYDETEGKVQPH